MEDIVSLLLDSLGESNLINVFATEVEITGAGISAIQKYEGNQKKLKNDRRKQWVIIMATIVLALAALIQVWVLYLTKISPGIK